METTPQKKPAGELCRYSPLHVLMLDNGLRRFFQDPRKILSGYIRPGMTVIDIGCGTGTFTLPVAEMVGEKGTVIAADVQREMLEHARKKSERSGLGSRLLWHNNSPDNLGVDRPVDFALSFNMVHEVQDPEQLFREVFQILRPGGKYFVIEPVFHVSERAFRQTLAIATSAGFRIQERPAVSLSRAALLGKA